MDNNCIVEVGEVDRLSDPDADDYEDFECYDEASAKSDLELFLALMELLDDLELNVLLRAAAGIESNTVD